MGLVRTTPLPQLSTLWTKVTGNDFIDGYAVDSTLPPKEALKVGLALPGWAMALLKLRNLIVSPFRLKTRIDNTMPGSIFPITYEDADEVIVGTDDWHLNFRIALRRHDNNIHMATWVHPNNIAGRIYLAVVMPFHILIVRDAMRRIAKAPIASNALAQ